MLSSFRPRRERYKANRLNDLGNSEINPKYRKSIVLLLTIAALVLVVLVQFLPLTKKHRIIMANEKGEMAIFVFNPNIATTVHIPVPEEMLVDASNNLGRWKAESLYKLAVQESIPPKRFLITSMAHGIGVPLQNSLITSRSIPKSTNRVFLIREILSADSDLSFTEKLRLSAFVATKGITYENVFEGLATKPDKVDPSVLSLVWPAYEKSQWIFSESIEEASGLVGVLVEKRVQRRVEKALDRLVAASGGKIVGFFESDLNLDTNSCSVSGTNNLAQLLRESLGCAKDNGTYDYPITVKMGEGYVDKF